MQQAPYKSKRRTNMKKSSLKHLALSFLALGVLGTVTSCNGFFSGDDAITISRVDTTTLQNGDTLVTIIYANEDKPSTSFTVPAGIGVTEVNANKNEKGETTITFKTSDGKSTSFTVPAVRSLDYIEPTYNEDGSITLTIHYTDGTTDKNQITLSKGEKGDPGQDGKDGKGIESIASQTQADGSIRLTITFSDGSIDDSIVIPQGTGVVSSESTADEEGNITVTLHYSNGESESFVLKRQSGWISGKGAPRPSQGQAGDFYYDQDGNAIYYFDADKGWQLMISLADQSNQLYTVTFDLNAADAKFLYEAQSQIQIKRGRNFYSESIEVPLASRPNYEFDGWYTSNVVKPTTGKFTDLTNVWGDIKLFARWVQA